MKATSRTNLLWGILFTCIFGSLLHFVYKWTGETPLAALFSPVNESVWEHCKLLFFPSLLYTVFEILVLSHGSRRFLAGRTAGILLGLLFMVAAYYTYTGASGRESLAADILIFILSVILAFAVSRFLALHCPKFSLPLPVSLGLLLIFTFLLFLFTFRPPGLPIFQPPDQSASSMIRLLPR